jgi:hypothetical protein
MTGGEGSEAQTHRSFTEPTLPHTARRNTSYWSGKKTKKGSDGHQRGSHRKKRLVESQRGGRQAIDASRVCARAQQQGHHDASLVSPERQAVDTLVAQPTGRPQPQSTTQTLCMALGTGSSKSVFSSREGYDSREQVQRRNEKVLTRCIATRRDRKTRAVKTMCAPEGAKSAWL